MKKVLKNSKATEEEVKKAKDDAFEAQKVGIYLKKEIKRRKDAEAASLAAAKEKKQKELDRKY